MGKGGTGAEALDHIFRGAPQQHLFLPQKTVNKQPAPLPCNVNPALLRSSLDSNVHTSYAYMTARKSYALNPPLLKTTRANPHTHTDARTHLPLQLIRVVEVKEGDDRGQHEGEDGEHGSRKGGGHQRHAQVLLLRFPERPQTVPLLLRQRVRLLLFTRIRGGRRSAGSWWSGSACLNVERYVN